MQSEFHSFILSVYRAAAADPNRFADPFDSALQALTNAMPHLKRQEARVLLADLIAHEPESAIG